MHFKFRVSDFRLLGLKTIFILTITVIFFLLPAFAEEENEVTVIEDKPTTLTYPSFWHTPFGIHRGTPFWLKVFLGNRTYFNDPQDLAATKLLRDYGKVRKGKDDWQLTVYGVNSGNSEVIYNSSMYSLDIFGEYGSGNGQLNRPIGIACNEHGDVYIADTGNNRIVRFYNNGKRVRFIRNIGGPGTEKGKFNRPTYIALDGMEKLYVSDTGNNRIQIFSKSGGLLRVIGKDKGIMNPQGIAVSEKNERYSGYKYDYIYVIDGNNNRIQKYDIKGNRVAAVRVDEALNRKVILTTLENDYYGNLYVVDNYNSRIYKFSPDLLYITEFGSYGSKDYEFERPTGIAIYKHFGQIMVSDKESAQYFWIGSDVIDFNSKHRTDHGLDMFVFEFVLTERGFVTIEVISDQKVVSICSKLPLEMGKNSITWDVPDLYRDTIFEPGHAYTVKCRLMATYSSYPHIEKLVKSVLYFKEKAR